MEAREQQSKKKILWAANAYWESTFKVGVHHYVKAFIEDDWEILLLSEPVSPFHFLSYGPKKDPLDRLKIWKRGGKDYLDGNLHAYSPFSFFVSHNKPILKSDWVLNRWQDFTVPNLFKYVKKKGFAEVDLLVIDMVTQGFWLDNIKAKKTILRITDDISGFKKITSNVVDRERDLIKRVDAVICTSKKMYEYALNLREGRATKYIPNGVDVDSFIQGSDEIPEDLKNIPEPRAIYVGAIEGWFDWDLVRATAKENQNLSFVIIGPIKKGQLPLDLPKNIYVLGAKKHQELPKYLKNSHLALIPFKVNPLTHSINPIKLYEYMACGLPVLSTDLNELRNLSSPAYLAQSKDDFIAATKDLLQAEDLPVKNIQFAKNADWSMRYAEFKDFLKLGE